MQKQRGKNGRWRKKRRKERPVERNRKSEKKKREKRERMVWGEKEIEVKYGNRKTVR